MRGRGGKTRSASFCTSSNLGCAKQVWSPDFCVAVAYGSRYNSETMGRPAGKQHDTTLNLRLPQETLVALRALAKRSKVSVAFLIRGGLVRAMSDSVAPLAAIAKDKKRSPRTRMRAADLIRTMAKGVIFLTPKGLEIARRRAAQAKAKEPAQTEKPDPTLDPDVFACPHCGAWGTVHDH